MTNNEPTTPDEAEERMRARFFTAATSAPPTDAQRDDVIAVREAVVQLAAEIERRVPAGRNKAIALTALEDVAMRANRGIFAPPEPRADDRAAEAKNAAAQAMSTATTALTAARNALEVAQRGAST